MKQILKLRIFGRLHSATKYSNELICNEQTLLVFIQRWVADVKKE